MQRAMRLILLRHAKSAWDTDAPTDHDRPLNARGRRDAPRIGQALRERGWIPDRILSSDAARTQETWRRMAPHLAPDAPVALHPSLYLCSTAVPLQLLAAQSDATIMVIGHNPTTEDLLPLLCGEQHQITTCNAALLESDQPGWAAAVRGRWRLVALLRPKELA